MEYSAGCGNKIYYPKKGKEKKRMKKRILALVLTVLMIVSVLPMTIFATEGEIPEVPAEDYTGTAYDSSLTAAPFTADPTKVYNADASYWQTISQYVQDSRNSSKNNDTGVWTLPGAGADSQLCLAQTANANTHIFQKNFAGLDVAVDIDMTVLSSSTTGHGYLSTWTPVSETNFNQYHLFTINVDKDAGTYALYWPQQGKDWVAGTVKICDITPDKQFNVRIVFDFDNGTAENYYLYIDGTLVGSSKVVSVRGSYGSIGTYQVGPQGAWQEALGEEAPVYNPGFMFNGVRYHSGKCVAMTVAKTNMFYYDDDADGDITDGARTVVVKAEADLNHYQDFEALELGNLASGSSLLSGKITASCKAGTLVVDDGIGGKALTTNAGGDIYYEVYPGLKSGVPFVTSMDIKLTGANAGQVCLVNGCAYGAYADINNDGVVDKTTTTERDFNLGVLYMEADGSIWTVKKSDGNSTGVLVNYYDNPSEYYDQKLCTLARDKYTNIAVAVDGANNTYQVYINGVAATEKLQLLTDTDFANLKAATNASNNPTFPNGYGLTHRRFQLRNFIHVDNIAVYQGNDIVNKNTDPLNGYVNQDGKLYCYENGHVMPNKNIDQGIVRTDVNGAVCVTYKDVTVYPAGLNELYVNLGNGDKVLVDGLYGGWYQAESGNRYCYGGTTRVTNISSPYFYGDTAYNYDEYGVASTQEGPHGNRLFVNGKVQKAGLYDYEGDKYYADADGNLLTGLYNIDGVYYEFDAETYKGTVKEAGEVVDNITNDTTGKVYDDIEDALADAAEGSTITVTEDINTDKDLTIGNNVTLNLNGNTITAAGLTIFAGTEIVDDAANRGVINVPKGTLIVSRETTDTTVYYEEGVGYKFANVKKQNADPEANENGDGFTFVFRPSLDNSTDLNKALFANGGDDNDMKFVVKLVNAEGETIRSFVYAEKVVKDAYANDLAFKLTVRKLDPVTHGTVTVYYGIETAAGMACYIEAGSFTPTAAEPVV